MWMLVIGWMVLGHCLSLCTAPVPNCHIGSVNWVVNRWVICHGTSCGLACCIWKSENLTNLWVSDFGWGCHPLWGGRWITYIQWWWRKFYSPLPRLVKTWNSTLVVERGPHWWTWKGELPLSRGVWETNCHIFDKKNFIEIILESI